jgi:hypothetical protein
MVINDTARAKNRPKLALSLASGSDSGMGVTLVSILREKGPASLRHCVILLASTAVIVTLGVKAKLKSRSK